jgi:hypothetical protein
VLDHSDRGRSLANVAKNDFHAARSTGRGVSSPPQGLNLPGGRSWLLQRCPLGRRLAIEEAWGLCGGGRGDRKQPWPYSKSCRGRSLRTSECVGRLIFPARTSSRAEMSELGGFSRRVLGLREIDTCTLLNQRKSTKPPPGFGRRARLGFGPQLARGLALARWIRLHGLADPPSGDRDRAGQEEGDR